MPIATIVVPAFNVSHCIAETLRSLLKQTASDYEIVVIDDGSTDTTPEIVTAFADPRIRLIRQRNRGLAGARNSGIHHARGAFIGFCDADDLWQPEKLAQHLDAFAADPALGLSYAGSAMIDERSQHLGLSQRPRLGPVGPREILLRNPVGNGSAPVFRRAALDDIAFRPEGETERDWWFDETFRQSEDIECWIRFALTTRWTVAGLPGDLTLYRINPGGLSASIERQLESWERVADKVCRIAPAFAAASVEDARAYQLRYLARRAISMGNGPLALRLSLRALGRSLHPLWNEPRKTATTLAAALVLSAFGRAPVAAGQRLLRQMRRAPA